MVEELWRLSMMFAMKFGVDVLQLQAWCGHCRLEVLDVIAGDPRSPRAAHVLDLNTFVSEEKNQSADLRLYTVHAVRPLIRKTKVMPQIQSKFPQTGGNLLST